MSVGLKKYSFLRNSYILRIPLIIMYDIKIFQVWIPTVVTKSGGQERGKGWKNRQETVISEGDPHHLDHTTRTVHEIPKRWHQVHRSALLCPSLGVTRSTWYIFCDSALKSFLMLLWQLFQSYWKEYRHTSKQFNHSNSRNNKTRLHPNILSEEQSKKHNNIIHLAKHRRPVRGQEIRQISY